MASRKRSIREMSAGCSSSSDCSSAGDSIGDGKPSYRRRACGNSLEASMLSPEAVKEAGLKILLEAERLVNPSSHGGDSSSSSRGASLNLPLVPDPFCPHKAWSEQTAKWSYDVLDHLQLPREIVYLSMNILEKALLVSDGNGDNGSTSTACSDSETEDVETNQPPQRRWYGITNKHEYEKIAITSLYLAVRLSTRQTVPDREAADASPPRHQRKLQISELLNISGSTWTEPEIQDCAFIILQSLGLWRKKPGDIAKWNFSLHQALVQATPHSFCKLLFFGFTKQEDESQDSTKIVTLQTRLAWLELSLYLIELSVCDGSCYRLLPSVVALASLQAACKILQAKHSAASPTSFQASKQAIEETLRRAEGVRELPNTTFVSNRLEYIYQQSQESNNRAAAEQGNNNRRGHSAARASAWSCPTLVMDDDEEGGEDGGVVQGKPEPMVLSNLEEEDDEEDTFFDSINDSSTTTMSTTTNYAAYATPGRQPEEDIDHQRQQQEPSVDRRPMQHIQSNLSLKGMADDHHDNDYTHRPISPCPSVDIHQWKHHHHCSSSSTGANGEGENTNDNIKKGATSNTM